MLLVTVVILVNSKFYGFVLVEFRNHGQKKFLMKNYVKK